MSPMSPHPFDIDIPLCQLQEKVGTRQEDWLSHNQHGTTFERPRYGLNGLSSTLVFEYSYLLCLNVFWDILGERYQRAL